MLRVHAGIVSLLLLGFGLGCTSQPVQPVAQTAVATADRCPASAEVCHALFGATPERTLPSSPAERFKVRLDKIRKPLSRLEEAAKNGAQNIEMDLRKEIIDAFTDDDVRSMLLQLQELESVYAEVARKKGEKQTEKLIDDQHTRMKDFENRIGAYMRAQELLKRTLKSETLDREVPNVKAAIVKHAGDEAGTELIAGLHSIGWDANPTKKLDELADEVKRFHLSGLQEDKLAYIKAVKKRVNLMIEEIKETKDQFKGDDWNEEQLNDGLHYLRRRLRETSMMLTTADGIFKFTNGPLPPGKAAEMEGFRPYGRDKYLEFPTLENPVEIPLYNILQLDWLVGKIGELKDFKESQLDLTEFLARPGMMKKNGLKKENDLAEARQLALKVISEYFRARNAQNPAKQMSLPDNGDNSIENQARGFRKYVRQQEVLESLIPYLDAGIEKLEKAAKKEKKRQKKD